MLFLHNVNVHFTLSIFLSGDIRIQMEAEKNWIYILTIHAHDYGIPQRRSINNTTLRVDTFDPTEIVDSIFLEINRKDFEIQQITSATTERIASSKVSQRTF